LLLYGYVDTRESPPQLVLRFWIAPQLKYRFEDIQGSHPAGKPIRVVDINNPGVGLQGELGRQSSAIALIGLGLADEQLGQSEDALLAFLRAGEFAPQSEMVQFFIGREYLFLSDLQPDQREANWQAAEEAFQKAINLNSQYARAYIGLGGVYFKHAASLSKEAVTAQQPVSPDAPQWVDKSIVAYQQALDLNPTTEQYSNPVADVARLALGNVYRLKGTIALQGGDVSSALVDFDQSIQLLEAVRPVFEAALPQHESYRRYLAQSYEYLGSAYFWQGQAFDTLQNYPQALAVYQKSMNAFTQCISQGENTLDLVIQNDIVGKSCQPSFAEVQSRYNELAGGQ
jgi:tetratricopeptide (TPR) repeat protein